MTTAKKPLKYHCPDHPDRAPFCAIGDYTPCRECYQKFRKTGRQEDRKTRIQELTDQATRRGELIIANYKLPARS